VLFLEPSQFYKMQKGSESKFQVNCSNAGNHNRTILRNLPTSQLTKEIRRNKRYNKNNGGEKGKGKHQRGSDRTQTNSKRRDDKPINRNNNNKT